MRVFWFSKTVISLPDALIQTLGIPCGFFYWHWKGFRRYVPVLFSLVLLAFMIFTGYDMWVHKLNFDTFTGRINPVNLPASFEAVTEEGEIVSDESLAGKIIILDFWHTKCGVCFEKFPQVQAAYDRYRTDPSVNILAVDKPLEEDRPGEAFKVIKAEGYAFQTVVSKDENMPENFGVQVYPTTFVIDREGEIVYKGGIEGAVKMVEELKQAE
jgi:thiol-disulfide isomerase/thioredoxin